MWHTHNRLRKPHIHFMRLSQSNSFHHFLTLNYRRKHWDFREEGAMWIPFKLFTINTDEKEMRWKNSRKLHFKCVCFNVSHYIVKKSKNLHVEMEMMKLFQHFLIEFLSFFPVFSSVFLLDQKSSSFLEFTWNCSFS